MYGLIHEAVHHFLMTLDNGEAIFAQVCDKIGMRDIIRTHHMYSDEDTLAFVGACCEVLGVDLATALTVSGQHFVQLCVEKGYSRLLVGSAKNFVSFMEGLDNLHGHLQTLYPGMRAPSYRCERIEGDTEAVRLHYNSAREGLWPLTVSIMSSAAKEFFGIEIVAEHLPERSGKVTSSSTHGWKEEFNVRLADSCKADHESLCAQFEKITLARMAEASASSAGPSASDTIVPPSKATTAAVNGASSLNPSVFDHLFPWHIEFQQNGGEGGGFSVTSMGSSVANYCGVDKSESIELARVASIVRPTLPPNPGITELLQLKNSAFWFRLNPSERHASQASIATASTAAGAAVPRSASYNSALVAERVEREEAIELALGSRDGVAGAQKHEGEEEKDTPSSSSSSPAAAAAATAALVIKGEVVRLDGNRVLFVGIPHLPNFDALTVAGLELTEIPMHTGGRETLLAGEHQGVTLTLAAKLEATTKELHSAKRQTDELLNSILPRDVAAALMRGEKVARTHDDVTVLFSDIEGFTKISSSVPPAAVMGMLDSLYEAFDAAAARHNVYKVETIGDAYMVVSGAPTDTADHASNVLNFALDMASAAASIRSPTDGKPLRVRVGVHSGACMSGVVGKVRPRYCLFGDTVNVASRMESTGVAGKIQVSNSARDAAIGGSGDACGFVFESRGKQTVKGKGEMETFFLQGKK